MPGDFDTAVLIGRFQPFHQGHAALLGEALRIGSRVVLVLGSAHAARTPRNPFTASEREAMIRASLTESDNARLLVAGQRDVWDARRWAAEVRRTVEALAPGRIALVGFHKDRSSSYLDAFPDWTAVETGRLSPLDATPLREELLSDRNPDLVSSALVGRIPEPALRLLSEWMCSPSRNELVEDVHAIRAYGQKHGKGPFVTVDALVRACGHVLLITRGKRPNRGGLALPGGFLEPEEGLEAGARRELREETGLSLHLAPSREAVFAHPGRSQRARIVTHAFLYEPDWETLPEVAGGDDAGSARWMPQADIAGLEDSFFEDHFHILDVFLGICSGV